MSKMKTTPIWLIVLNHLAVADQRFRDAQKLKLLSDERLEDMGMTRSDAEGAFQRKRSTRPTERKQLALSRST